MKTLIVFSIFYLVLNVESIQKTDLYKNVSQLYQPVERQLMDFKLEHPVPIGLYTMSSGEPTEIRDIFTVNSDAFNNPLLIDTMSSFNGERIPERVVHAKGTGAFGYLEVTNDVSQYTYADLFNGIGKKTPLVARFSFAAQNLGGSELTRELMGMSIKFYTKQGNFDLTCMQTPVYFYRDPIQFSRFVHAFKRNPKTNLFDQLARWDGVLNMPVLAHAFFWILSDYGVPDGYRKSDYFPIHTYELANKKGETHYVRFNVRTEQGFTPLTTEQALAIGDPDYFTRDLYNNIEIKNFPKWRLEMDVMTKQDIQKIDYDPFDVTKLWVNGTFFTMQIGRIVLNRNVDNQFRDIEEGAFNPANLVPGIPGPVDQLFRGRRSFYRDTQNYRLGRNHNNININQPLYEKTYNRDGKPPTRHNGRDAPNYYPNSFNGPAPYVDEKRPKDKLITLENSAVDLAPLSYLYNHILNSEPQRQRFIDNVVLSLVPVPPPTLQRVFKFLYLIDFDFGRRVEIGVQIALDERAQRLGDAAVPPTPGPIRNTPIYVNDCK